MTYKLGVCHLIFKYKKFFGTLFLDRYLNETVHTPQTEIGIDTERLQQNFNLMIFAKLISWFSCCWYEVLNITYQANTLVHFLVFQQRTENLHLTLKGQLEATSISFYKSYKTYSPHRAMLSNLITLEVQINIESAEARRGWELATAESSQHGRRHEVPSGSPLINSNTILNVAVSPEMINWCTQEQRKENFRAKCLDGFN